MLSFFQDVRYGVRMLLKNAGFTAVAVSTLAVGIGANAVIYCIARSMIFPSLPYPDSGGILNLVQTHRVTGGFASSIPDYLEWKEQNQVFSQIAAVSYGWSTISGGTEPEDVDTAFVSEDFFALLGVAPIAGRLFLPEEYRPGAERVMILSHGYWQRQLGGNPAAIGRQLALSGDVFTVVGIMPREFEDPFFTKAFLPLSARKDSIPSDRANRRAGVFARLKPGVSLDQAQREMSVISDRLAKAYPATNKDVSVMVQPWRERMGSRFRTMVGLLLGAVGFVLLIGCVNVANLLMARAASRQREVAIRLAMGARRARLVRQLLTESLVLATLGGATGVILAFWAIPILNGIYSVGRPFVMDLSVLAVTTALAGATALLFGSMPAFLLARLGTGDSLNDRTPQSSGARTHRFRDALVIVELALSLVLLYGASLLIQSFLRYESLDKGFNPRNVLDVAVNVYKDRYASGSQVVDFGSNVLAQFERLPAGDSAAVTTPISLKSGPGNWGISIAGGNSQATTSAPLVDPIAVSSDYFRVMEIPLLRGRAFTRAESEQGAQIVILSETLAQRLWPGEDPIGKPLKLETGLNEMPWLSVTGVARDARGNSFPSVTSEAMGLYVPFGLMRIGDGIAIRTGGNRDGRYTSLHFYIRSGSDPMSLSGPARTAVLQIDKQQPIFSVRTMEEKLYQEGSSRRALAILIGLFAFVALLLAAVGTYGVMAYSVSERTPEIGIRMALGAQRDDALLLVLRHGMRLVSTGLPLGFGGAYMLSGFLQNQLFGISAGDPVTLAGVSAVLTAIASLACYMPALRAARVNPIVALRYE